MFHYLKTYLQSLILTSTLGYLIFKYIKSKKRLNGKNIIVISSIKDWNSMKKEVMSVLSSSEVIGLDCEWITVEENRKPISLLQLSNACGYCVLIQLSKLPLTFLASLKRFLESEETLKVGVGISDDVLKLYIDYGIVVHNYIDLRYLTKDLKEMQNKNLSLQSIGSELLGIQINKSKILRCSNWDASILTIEQIKYAADDAIISAQIFKEIKRRKTNFLGKTSKDFLSQIENYIDLPFKQNINRKESETNLPKRNKPLKTRYSKPRQKLMYDNCQLLAPDGELLCSCDKGKAEWYIFKGLGVKINDEPFTVQLNFEPSGRPILDNIFYTKEKCNHCVVCGKTENFHRKLVVPSEYRKYFPDIMKKNLSHDVLLLCEHCHKSSNILDHQMREKLAKLCKAPLGCKKNVKYKFDPELAKVKSAAKALKNSGEKIPQHRQVYLKQIIINYFNASSFTPELTEEVLSLDTSSLNHSFISHGLKVYQYFCENGGLINFERMWRQHFLDTMQPKYLPIMWSVEHNHERLTLQVLNNEREINFDKSILGLNVNL